MDKSSPIGYTHDPSGRIGMTESSDDSVSRLSENARLQKSVHSTPKHRRSYKKRLPDAERHHLAEKVHSVSWEPRRRELVKCKGDRNTSDFKMHSPGTAKVLKRHYGTLQKTSPIADSGDLEVDSEAYYSLQKDFQKYMVKCNHDLIKELKDFKLCFSKQIMNLQLDVDKILANLQNKNTFTSKGVFSGGSFHRTQRAAVVSIEGERYSLPSAALESHYTDTRNEGNVGSRCRERSGNDTPAGKSVLAPSECHEFRNFQNNPIYHVENSPEKRNRSCDSDNSISSVEMTSVHPRDGQGSFQNPQPESNGKDPCSSEDLNLVGRGLNSGNQRKNNGSVCAGPLVNYRPFSEIGPAANFHNHDAPFKENRPLSNGHSISTYARSQNLNKRSQSRTDKSPVNRLLLLGASKTSQKDDASMSSMLGGCNSESEGINENVKGHFGALTIATNTGSTPEKTNLHMTHNKSRPLTSTSRPLFCEDLKENRWRSLSSTAATLVYGREENHPQDNEQTGLELGRPRYQDFTAESQADVQPFTLRGWAAAFLQSPTEVKSQDLAPALPSKYAAVSFVQESPKKDQPVVQDSPKVDQYKEKENGSQCIVRQFAGKSAKGGCAWTVSEPVSSPRSSPRESSVDGTRPKIHYSINNRRLQ